MNINTFIPILLITIAAAGCATAPPSSGPPPSVFEKSKKVFGQEKAMLVWVPSSGAVADTTFSGASAVPPSRMARGLGRTFAIAKSGQISVAAAGPSSGKTRRVVADALSLQDGMLPGLRLLFIGDPTDGDAVRTAVEARGGAFYFEPYE